LPSLEQAPNPYAPPKSTAPGGANRIAYGISVLGLLVYAGFGLASVPFVPLAWRQMSLAIQHYGGAERAYNTLAAAFYGLRAISDVGLLVAFVAGLVWLYHAWQRSERSRKKGGPSAGAVVVWTLVPVWGFWRLYGFLLELSRRSAVSEGYVKVGRWWWFVAVHVVVRVLTSQLHVLGGLHVVDSLLQAAAALLGVQMMRKIQRAQDAKEPRVDAR
jgi:Domain of unknown function (DUF4328)